MLSCDGCGKVAPSGYNHLFPSRGWTALRTWGKPGEDLIESDACSPECLLILASRLTGFEVGPAEPVAAKPRRRKSGAVET